MRIDTSVPCVGAGFCDDVHHRAGIAPVLRAKLAGDQDILLDEFGVRKEKARTTDAVVIIILPVDLLVIVAAAQAVHGKSGAAVGVGKSIVAGGDYAGNEQGQVIKSLILSDTGKRGQLCSGKSVRDL